jgi:hypothetical protein
MDDKERCPSCQGRFWSVKLGKWVNTRETVGMICMTCGRDYFGQDKEADMERYLIDMIYAQVLPAMKEQGIEDTPKNRYGYLIGVRSAYQEQSLILPGVVDALTAEIIRLGDELPID